VAYPTAADDSAGRADERAGADLAEVDLDATVVYLALQDSVYRPDLVGRLGHPDLVGLLGHPDLVGLLGHPDWVGPLDLPVMAGCLAAVVDFAGEAAKVPAVRASNSTRSLCE
jgi:hypothetical protein